MIMSGGKQSSGTTAAVEASAPPRFEFGDSQPAGAATQEDSIAPSSPSVTSSFNALAANARALVHNDALPQVQTDVARAASVTAQTPSVVAHHCRTPSDAGLRLQTDLDYIKRTPTKATSPITPTITAGDFDMPQQTSTVTPSAAHKSPLRSTLSAASMTSLHSLSPGSAFSSPALNAMADITPLPSPLITGDSPGPWKRLGYRPGSSDSASMPQAAIGDTDPSSQEEKAKAYQSLAPTPMDRLHINRQQNTASHARNRSVSEFMPEPLHNVRPRNVTISSGARGPAESHLSGESGMHREAYLAHQRGLTSELTTPHRAPDLPTPPPSNRSVTESDDGDEEIKLADSRATLSSARAVSLKRKRHWRSIRELGRGTFSKVMLATSEDVDLKNPIDESKLDPKQLVAVKVVEHGAAGGANEERVEMGLKREIEIMQSVSHPSLVHLIDYAINDDRALLILNYCAGGDLFEFASAHRDLITPALVQRITTELVDAVRYLHSEYIVHRDIKLENVLLNIPAASIPTIPSLAQHPEALVTLTDVGLSRHIPRPPDSPLLRTRCGSEDYAAPELILGQPYDGRRTDAWALGVLIYALMEGRLPFDPHRPGSRHYNPRARVSHLVARCEWMWCRFGDEDGVWDPVAGKGWEGAQVVVEGLLKKLSRGRLSLDAVAELEWVQQGIAVEGGLKPREDVVLEDFVLDEGIDFEEQQSLETRTSS